MPIYLDFITREAKIQKHRKKISKSLFNAVKNLTPDTFNTIVTISTDRVTPSNGNGKAILNGIRNILETQEFDSKVRVDLQPQKKPPYDMQKTIKQKLCDLINEDSEVVGEVYRVVCVLYRQGQNQYNIAGLVLEYDIVPASLVATYNVDSSEESES